jgi:geranylgeranyl diphosphate synthase, type I
MTDGPGHASDLAAGDRPRSLPRLFAATQALLQPALRETIAVLPDSMARICGYHLGWLDSRGEPAATATTGKALRATLALLAAEGSGGDAGQALPAAVAVELVHNFSLLHDDIIDNDQVRRGRPAAWTVFGTGPAVLAGDALVDLAHQAVASAADSAPGLRDHLISAIAALNRGQARDLEFERRDPATVTVETYLDMAADKTGSLLAFALVSGACSGGADDNTVEALRLAGHHLGLAWQAANDVEDIWAEVAVTGKPAMGDLQQGKPTLPVITALHSPASPGPPLRQALREAVGDPARAAEAAALIEAAGGRAATQELSAAHLASAHQALRKASLRGHARAELNALITYLVTRSDPPTQSRHDQHSPHTQKEPA